LKADDMRAFKENVDGWIRKINTDVESFRDLPSVVEYNIDNNQHNYEILQEMMQEINILKEELNIMRTIQAALLESSVKKLKS